MGARRPVTIDVAVLARHSIANVALPTLAQAFTASFQAVQWIVLAYLLAITTLIVSVGRLGDITGRRRLLLAGIILFTAASTLCGFAPALWLLIAARAAQGLGAAIMMALTMALVGETVPKEKPVAPWGCSERCRDWHRARSFAWRRSDLRTRVAGHLLRQRYHWAF